MKTNLPHIKLTQEDLEKRCSHAILVNYLGEQLILCSIDKGKAVPMFVSERFGYGFCNAVNSSYSSYFIRMGIKQKIDLKTLDHCEEKSDYVSV